ncbi:hypothetical protein ACMA1D_00850 [Streptomyces sp. 796.1]|uniref:hypothetical protein n=1 Tax=Streptomyces sp. 796.1 TaxID=3163029 RepID=UPI0039C8CDA6
MTLTFTADEGEDAARLIAYAVRVRLRPAKDGAYKALVDRYQRQEPFRLLVDRVAAGLGLRVLGAASDIGLALAATPHSVFETKIEDYAVRTKYRGEGEKLLHGIVHLAVAALAFPRPDDLANDTYTGRVSVDAVDRAVRDTCDRLREKSRAADDSTDRPTDTPELEKTWSAYVRRPEASLTKDKRLASDSTRALITKALRFLEEQGFLVLAGREDDGWYRTTPRYQWQVRELAETAAFEELLSLGVVPLSSSGVLRAKPPSDAADRADAGPDAERENAGV